LKCSECGWELLCGEEEKYEGNALCWRCEDRWSFYSRAMRVAMNAPVERVVGGQDGAAGSADNKEDQEREATKIIREGEDY
jgi:hypothetical protein